jgi:hypothetical protein
MDVFIVILVSSYVLVLSLVCLGTYRVHRKLNDRITTHSINYTVLFHEKYNLRPRESNESISRLPPSMRDYASRVQRSY